MRQLIIITFLIISISSSGATEKRISSSNEISASGFAPNTGIDTINFKAHSEGYNFEVFILKKSDHKEKLPAIIFIVGSGEFSTLENYKDFTEFFFEETLLENFAIVYFDKRGLGNSEGIWYETTFEERALDAKNVALEIQNLDFINENKIYIIGHSQGGWIVQIALANYPDIFAGGISMAGPTFSVKRQLINDYQNKIICKKGISDLKALRKANRRVKRDLFLISILGRKGNLKQLKIIKDFEPKPYLKAIKKPILLLFAENDLLVNPSWCIEELKRLYPDGLPSFFEYYIAKGENHSFKVAPKCYNGEWDEINFSEATKQKIYEWLKPMY